MLQTTKGIVLRSVKYGDSSLVTTIFTEVYGVQAYMVQGVRTAKAARNKAGLLQPGTILDMVVYHQPGKAMQRIKEFSPAIVYNNLQQDVARNSIALFSVEVLLRLLPADAAQPDLFEIAEEYLSRLDKQPLPALGNYPLYFVMQCGREMGYEARGDYNSETRYLNIQEGGFAAHPQANPPYTTDADAAALHRLLKAAGYDALQEIALNGETRMRLTEWYVAFLQAYSQHMGNIRSLAVLKAILH